MTLQAALLARYAPAAVADALLPPPGSDAGPAAGPGTPFGSLPDGLDLAAILERSPVVTGR